MNKVFKFSKSLVTTFFKHDCINLAASISFCALLSIVPIGMIMVSFAGYFLGGSNTVYQELVNLISQILPVGKELVFANIESVMAKKSSLGLMGIFFLLFISTFFDISN